jgi:hypothetical protein
MANNENTKNKGAAVDATTPQTKTTKLNSTDNSRFYQRIKLLDWLLEKGSISTDQAREHLDVMHPAGRIKELREDGYLISTIWVVWESDYGIKHRVAKYVLMRKEPLENLELSEVA